MKECVSCGGELTGRQRSYCSPQCSKQGGRASWVLKTYGITMIEWDKIFQEQGGKCGICKRLPRSGETFHLDHEHRTGPSGPVRGILCPYCNSRLVGRLKDATKAQALADYLREPPAFRALGRVVEAPGRPKKRRSTRKGKRTK